MGNESTIKPYTSLTLEEINNRYSMILSLWDSFLKTVGEPKLKYIVNKQNLYEVIKRQDKRMYYYRVFHKLDYPCEYKFMAIECFWINTLKPRQVYLTHMGMRMDYETLCNELPLSIRPAYDGLEFDVNE